MSMPKIGPCEHCGRSDVFGQISIPATEPAAAAPVTPEGLHPDTASLVTRFASAMAEKLHAAEIKYGYSNFWMAAWEAECRQKLHEHLAKGDPRDVANYCAFMWHHGWSTAAAVEPTAANSAAHAHAEFFRKYALGDKAIPSCLCCGHSELPEDRTGGVRHLELHGIFVCKKCKDAAESAAADRWDRVALDCAALLRRWCWQAKKTEGDNSLKVLAGQTDDYLRRVGLRGSPLRGEPAAAGEAGKAWNHPDFESAVFDEIARFLEKNYPKNLYPRWYSALEEASWAATIPKYRALRANPPTAQPLPAGGVDESPSYEDAVKAWHGLSNKEQETFAPDSWVAGWLVRSRLSQDVGVYSIMEQASVYASAWSLVGSRFDNGDALKDVNDAKEGLREMVRSRLSRGEGRDSEYLEAIAANYWDLRCFDIPTGSGDADVGWEVVSHHTSNPKERQVGVAHRDNPREALAAALASDAAQGKGQ